MEGNDSKGRQEIFSNVVRAGRRTYFFDVKKTRKGDLYLTITESKKMFDKEGAFHFEKHKLFLYKEDFDKFTESLNNSVNFIDENVEDFLENPEMETPLQASKPEAEDVVDAQKAQDEKPEDNEIPNPDFTDVDFDDLDKD
ncbi:MAG: DUF3276 family protein [Bacteroidales bacterium]|jgi:hypothetical protein|nr:DUF3276 family protein [Bacteroidales bacterium]